jgi:hypothetical protein
LQIHEYFHPTTEVGGKKLEKLLTKSKSIFFINKVLINLKQLQITNTQRLNRYNLTIIKSEIKTKKRIRNRFISTTLFQARCLSKESQKALGFSHVINFVPTIGCLIFDIWYKQKIMILGKASILSQLLLE